MLYAIMINTALGTYVERIHVIVHGHVTQGQVS